MGSEIRIAVSTGCFTPSLHDLRRLEPSALWGFVNPMVEVNQALEAVERLGLDGIELALRVWPILGFAFWPWQLFTNRLREKVVGVHGQVGGSWPHVFRWIADDPLSGAMVATMGVWDRRTERLAKQLRAEYLVIHPETIRELERRGIFLISYERRLWWGIENNWATRQARSQTLGWQVADVRNIAQTHKLPVVLDISHLLLTDQNLVEAWEQLEPFVTTIHFSGAAPWTPEMGGTPPYLLPEEAQAKVREFLSALEGWEGIITIELSPTSVWRERLTVTEGVKRTLDFLGENL